MSSSCPTAILEAALAGNLSPEDESSLYRHLDTCELCSAALEQMAGGQAWCEEAASLLARDRLDEDVPTGNEWSDVDFTVEHLEPSDEPNVLGRLGGYDVLEVIGRGGMGIVLKGYDRQLKRCIAIKVLTPHLAQSSLAKKRFAREAQAAAAVVHPHVMPIHQVQSHGKLPFLVMPLVAGESLAERLKAQGTLEVKEILRIGMQAAAGLAAAHEQGLVHRDVKPANILLEKGVERAVLTDFGLARAADDVTLTRWGIVAGTPQYMSPEQARGEPLDGRSDLFSLGCVFYEMATGVSPFRSDTMLATMRRLVDDRPQSMSSLNPELPQWFIQIVERLLEKDPSCRFQSAKEVSDLLEDCLAHLHQPSAVPLPAALAKPIARSEVRNSRSRIVRALAVIAAFGIGVFGLALASATPPNIAGEWSGEEWGDIVLKTTIDGEYEGTYSDTLGNQPGKIRLKWSRIERRFNGQWSEGTDRFGEISVRLLGDEIHGAHTTDSASRVNPATPRLADLLWRRRVVDVQSREKRAAPFTTNRTTLPRQLFATKEHVVRIEALLKDAPVTTNYLAELFEQTPGMAGEYRLRSDVVSIRIFPADKSQISSLPLGNVHYIPRSKCFYIQWDDIAASTLHYYGPFYGISLDTLGLADNLPAGAMPKVRKPVGRRVSPKTDLDRLQGTWHGYKRTPAEQYTVDLTIEGTRFIEIQHRKPDRRMQLRQGRIELNESAEPKQLTMWETSRNPRETKAIYKLDSDGLTMRMSLNERPTAFDQNDPGQIVFNRQERRELGQELTDLRRKLIGTWQGSSFVNDGAIILEQDGTFKHPASDDPEERGVWTLEGRELVRQIEESGYRSRVGVVVRREVVEVTDSTLQLAERESEGRGTVTYTYTRVNEVSERRKAGPAAGGSPSDNRKQLQDLEKLLVGTWVGYADRHGESYTFQADGTFEHEVTIGAHATCNGTWAFDSRTLPPSLVLHINESDDNEFPAGNTKTFKVVGLDAGRLAFENPNGIDLGYGEPPPVTFKRAPRLELRCELHSDKPSWNLEEAPRLLCRIENSGKLRYPTRLHQGFHRIEVDGRPYVWAGDVPSGTDVIDAGKQAEIHFRLSESDWVPLWTVDFRENKRLQLDEGKHTVRVCIYAGSGGQVSLTDATAGPPIQVWSNAVEIEVATSARDGPNPIRATHQPSDAKPGRTDLLGRWQCDDNGLAGVLFTLDINDDGTYSSVRRDTAPQSEDVTRGMWEFDNDRPSILLRSEEDTKTGGMQQTASVLITRDDGVWALIHPKHGRYVRHKTVEVNTP